MIKEKLVNTGNKLPYSKEFDEKYRYDGKDLGVTCGAEGTMFKVWSPLSDRIELHLYENDSTECCRSYDLLPQEQGTWKWESPENLHGTYYDYTVYREGTAVTTADPYAIGCGCNGIRSMVVDLSRTDPEGFAKDAAPAPGSETIIYELHIKDFSHDPDSGIPPQYRGKYKAFTVMGSNGKYPTCMEYLKKLGITHVHLLPMFDYAHLDEDGGEEQFNWGYDPLNYNVPEGSYSTNPHDGTVRIRECKEMIQALHQNGIRVVMDVVYNHTDSQDSWFERMAPGYYYRHLPDGSLSDGSACGNDFAAGRAMVDNYIVDSVLYWAKEYHIDGFRFDLMGLLTVELMNRIRRELDAVYGAGEKLLYGEPWSAAESPMEPGTMPAMKANVEYLEEGVAIFSDDIRDAIKGNVFYEEVPGFVNGGKQLEEGILNAVTGWCSPMDGTAAFHPKSCAQIINYVSAHDNLTLWDKLVLSMHGRNWDAPFSDKEDVEKRLAEQACDAGKAGNRKAWFTHKYEDILAANKLAAFIYFTCQGQLFMQAGEEFGRTKLGDENSYRSAPEINMLRWQQTVEFSDLLEYYQGLIRLRKQLPGFYDKSAAARERITDRKIWQEGVVSFVVDNESEKEGTVPFAVDNKREKARSAVPEEKECWEQLFVVYNAAKEAVTITLPQGSWEILADGQESDCRRAVEACQDGQVVVEACSGMLFGRK